MMIVDAIFGGFVSKVINDYGDIKKEKIKCALDDKNNRSFDTKIYRVIENALITVTHNKYNNQDKLYDAVSCLFKEFKNSRGNNETAIKAALKILDSSIGDYECEEFISKFYDGICQDEDLYKRISLILQEKGIGINRDGFQRINEKLDSLDEKISSKSNDEFGFQKREPVKSRTQEYADKWNANMFLNDFDRRDENAGVNIKLKEVYSEEQLPHYLWGCNKNISKDIKNLLSEYIEKSESNKSTPLLILGHPGIGKSTLITWIVANFSCRINDILVYQFASDLKNIDWNCTTKDYMYWDEILNVLGLTHDDLHGKVLIFDGFDEINVKINRIDILNKLMSKEIKGLSADFSLIVTCRENYIHGINKIKYNYITLQPWNSEQIKSFCKLYSEKSKYNISKDTMVNILNTMEIFGIPLILYMVLALNISVEKAGSIVDVYDKVFTLDGGIYDRCINNRRFAEAHRIGEVKQQIHQISRKIAVWMFENNQVEAYIPQNEYQKICNSILEENQGKEDIQKDFLIGNYFSLVKHCEGLETETLYFVHRSIYEYFVAEAIYSSIEKAMIELTDESQEELACKIAPYLKQGLITNNIDLYLQYKILKLYNSFDDRKKECFYQWWENAIHRMINKGMFFFTSENIQKYENIVEKEIQCFYNLVKILRLLFKTTSTKKYILENVDKWQLEKYIRFRFVMCRMEERYGAERFNLSEISLAGINLSGVDFTCANLNDVNLSGANLSGANFQGMCFLRTNFQGADLSGADLKSVNLIGTNLREADLRDAKLVGSLFSEDQIKYLKGKYDLSGTYVDIPEINKDVDYEEYCKEYL